jgi:hypothetical protein
MIRASLLLSLLLAGAVTAAEPGDYAWGWPLQLQQDAAAHRVELPEAVYRQLRDPRLRDLEVFNAAGESVPFGPVPAPPSAQAEPLRMTLPWFLLPDRQAEAVVAQAVTLRIERDADGRLRGLDAAVPDAADGDSAGSLLVELDAPEARLDGLELHWTRDGDVSARFRVAVSDDLARWRTLRDAVGVADLQQGGFSLLRNRIDLPRLGERYLLLTRIDGGTPLAVEHVTGLVRAPQQFELPALQWIELTATVDPTEPSAWLYEAPGPLPVSQIDVRLASANSVAALEVSSRDLAHGDEHAARWRRRAGFTAFRLAGPDGEAAPIESQAQPITPTRDRHWRVSAGPGLDRPPTLRLGYRPDVFALLARGQGPFLLAAGSAQAQRPDYPIAALLAEWRARREAGLAMAEASLGNAEQLAGDAAYRSGRALPWRQWLLWGVLVLGAGLVLGMVVKLVRGE